MKIKNAKVGDTVYGKQGFKPKYTIRKVRKKTIDVDHDTGTTIMTGGKSAPNIYKYKRVDPKNLTKGGK